VTAPGGLDAALAALSDRFALPDSAPRQLAALLALLERDPSAPTTVTRPADALDVHLADSLVAVELEEVRTARSLADIGAGAGFPGLALAVAVPGARVLLVESAARKCAFLERAIVAAGIANAEVVCARVETRRTAAGMCDVVSARALATLPVVVEYAAPLLRVGGMLVAWKGRRDPDEEADTAAAAAQVGLAPVEVRRVRPYPAATHRHLHVLRKVAPTPDRFPRRPGAAAKRPLRAR
jgi:16S rRNA (guanine527-N7)-methyltransferase